MPAPLLRAFFQAKVFGLFIAAGLSCQLSEPCASAAEIDDARPESQRLELLPNEIWHSLAKAKVPLVVGDRFEYGADEGVAQFLVLLLKPTEDLSGRQLTVELRGAAAAPDAPPLATLSTAETARCALRLRLAALPIGDYVCLARLDTAAGPDKPVEGRFFFKKSARRQLTLPFPADGIPLDLEPQKYLPDTVWPVRSGVPLPFNAVADTSRLALFENDKQVPVQVAPRATWSPQGSVKWVHVDFLGRYQQGKPAKYRLRQLPSPIAPPQTELQCTTTDDAITVETGALRFIVNRRQFNGIERAWCAPARDGKYDLAHPIVDGSAGPYLVDSRLIRFDASRDPNVRVEIEEQGPLRVTILASGWYTSAEGRVEPLSRFNTRITAFAGQSSVRVMHHTILTYDTRLFRLADAGFHIGLPETETYRLGVDGQTLTGKLPAAPNTMFMHQFRYDHLRVMGTPSPRPVEGKTSDGWLSALSGAGTTTVCLRDIWQKFPKELELGRDSLQLHFWPKHGVRAFHLADELDIKNIYKFWCFHQGPLLDLNLPDPYYEKFVNEYKDETVECRPEHALNGNGQGLAIGNEFLLDFRAPAAADESARLAALFQFDPAAPADRQWNAATGALGNLAAVDPEYFAPLEEAMEQGFLSYTRCTQRGREYGMWNFTDTHTYWHIEQNRADLHRVWQNSHYRQVSTAWLMYFRSGTGDMLRWARHATDHYMNVSTVNYADQEKPLKFHDVGAMYHCKGLTPWGSEAFGMERHDGHSGYTSHWCDPDSLLWCWYIDGNSRANDVYGLFSGAIREQRGFPLEGLTREGNSALALAISYYQATWDPSTLAAIHGLGESLRSRPLEQQVPGPLWHPLWMTRYQEQTRDPQYTEFILKYARNLRMEGVWTLALGALAFDLTGDVSYLTQHFAALESFPRICFRAPGDPYDWYGAGPGPLGSGWAYESWPYMAAALRRAGLTRIDIPRDLPGTLPAALTDPYLRVPTAIVLAYKATDRPFEIRLRAPHLTHVAKISVFGPTGKLARQIELDASMTAAIDHTELIPADGATGMYRLEMRLQESQAFFQLPLTNLDSEAVVWHKDRIVRTERMLGWLHPLSHKSVYGIKIVADADRYPCTYRITDVNGKVVVDGTLLKERGRPDASITLDPAKAPAPWRLDVIGQASVVWRGDSSSPLLWSTSAREVKALFETLNLPQTAVK